MLTATLTKSSLATGTLLAASLLATIGLGVHQLWAESSDNPNGNASRPASVQTVIKTNDNSQNRQTVPLLTLGDGEAGARTNANPLRPPSTARNPQAVDFKRLNESEQRIEAALSEETQIEFIDTPLVDAMQFITDLHKITIILDETALGEEGIATVEPITQVLSGISLESVLNITLKPLGLTYLIEDEVLKITTEIVEEARKETRVYPIQDLVAAGIEIEPLMRIIEKQSNDENNSVESLAELLVVTQSQRQHRKTVDLLEQLRRSETVKP